MTTYSGAAWWVKNVLPLLAEKLRNVFAEMAFLQMEILIKQGEKKQVS